MVPSRFRIAAGLVLVVVALTLGCSRPKAPTVHVNRVAVSQISPSGVALLLGLTLTNPNSIGFSVRSVQAKIRLDGRYDLGPVVVPHSVHLPPRQPVPLEVPLQLAWSDVAALTTLAGENRDVDYDVDGSVAVGTESVSFDVPVNWHAVLRREDLVRAAFRGLPGLLPGGR